MSRLTVTRQDGPLNERKWAFLYFESRHLFVLDSYYVTERPSKRHSFKVKQLYERQPYNDGSHYGVPRLKEADVPLPEDVLNEVRDEFMRTLRILRWDDYEREEKRR